MLGIGLGVTSVSILSVRQEPYDLEAALGSDLLAWWDADHTDLITLVSTDRVSAWEDRVNGYTVTQDTSASRPTYFEAGFRGRPGITFDGIDDFLDLSSAPLPSGADPAEVWAALSLDADVDEAGTKTFLGWGTANFAIRHFGRATPDGVSLARALSGTGEENIAAFQDDPYQGRHVYRGLVSETGVSVALDGGDLSAETSGVSATGTARTRVGSQAIEMAGQYWPGTIGAVVVTKPLGPEKSVPLRNWLQRRV